MSATAADPDDSAMTSGGSGDGGGGDVSRVLRLSGAKSNSRLLTSFTWRRRRDVQSHPDERNDPRNPDAPEYRAGSISTGFFQNIKRRLRIKKLGLCKAKQKIQAIDAQCQVEDGEDATPPRAERPLSFAGKADTTAANERLGSGESADWIQRLAQNGVDEALLNEADACWESYGSFGDTETNDAERDLRLAAAAGEANENAEEASPPRAGNVAEPQSTSARESVADGVDARLNSECKAKVNLSEELLKLSKHGWYWGPISGDEADSKLVSEPDGAFLVRDSSDDKYLLTLSFKSSGRLLHARMEHSGGLFSLCNQSENEGFTSVAALIDHSMNSSQSAIFCYSRPRHPGHPSFPVRLTKPVSRFTQVRSLQYLCRFVIRQNTRLDNIHKLPLPKTIKGYIEEAHY